MRALQRKQEALKKEHGVSHMPAFGRLFRHSVINNCIHDFMHLYYNTILLVFQYIIRMHFSKNTTRHKEFKAEKRKIEVEVGPRNQTQLIANDDTLLRGIGEGVGALASEQ